MLQQRSTSSLDVHTGKSQANNQMLNCFLYLAPVQQQLEQCPIPGFIIFLIRWICQKTFRAETNTTNQLENIALQKATELHLSRLLKRSLRSDLSVKAATSCIHFLIQNSKIQEDFCIKTSNNGILLIRSDQKLGTFCLLFLKNNLLLE